MSVLVHLPDAIIAMMSDVSGYEAVLPTELRGGPPTTASWWSWRDLTVRLHRIARPEASVVVILLHGGGGHAEMVMPYARLLPDDGCWEVLAPDLPGYGESTVARPVSYDDWRTLVADLVREQTRPVVLVGASMGGLLAYDVAALVGERVVAVVATCLIDPADRRVRRATSRWPALAGHGRRFAHRLAPLDAVRMPIRWVVRMREMTSDPALLDAVLADRRGGGNTVSVRFLRTWLASSPEVGPEQFTVCPVVLAHPGADTWTPLELSVRFLRRIAAPTELVVLENCGHLPVEQPGLGQLGEVLVRVVTEVGRLDR